MQRVSRKTFAQVFSQAKVFSGPGLKLRFFATPDLKVSFILSKKIFKLATLRNLWKRRGYFVLRKIKNKIKPGIYLFFLGPQIKNSSFKEFEEKIFSLLKKANLYE